MNEEIRLNDIADELLILNKVTIDTLFRLENCADCIALYVFYYKTAKWQKTDTIKANDTYITKSLKWGSKKIRETKKILKEQGLIDIVQRRTNGKIDGWYVKISYLVSQRKTEDVKIIVENTTSSNNAQKQQVAEATSGFEETNALKEKIKCLNKELEMLKNNNSKKVSLETDDINLSSDEIKKEKKKKTKKDSLLSFDEMFDLFTDDGETKYLLREWIKVRKVKRSALTNKAIELNLKKLNKLALESNMSVNEYLEEVIAKGWASFYAIENFSNKKTNNRISNRPAKYVREEVVPDWLNKKIEPTKQTITPEDQKEWDDFIAGLNNKEVKEKSDIDNEIDNFLPFKDEEVEKQKQIEKQEQLENEQQIEKQKHDEFLERKAKLEEKLKSKYGKDNIKQEETPSSEPKENVTFGDEHIPLEDESDYKSMDIEDFLNNLDKDK